MSNTKFDLANGWHDLGVRLGGVLLVHASLRSLGPLDGGAETVVLSLLEALGPHGTLLMPALSYVDPNLRFSTWPLPHPVWGRCPSIFARALAQYARSTRPIPCRAQGRW